MSKNTARPTHRAYFVVGEGDNARWHELGPVWSHKDGEGFSLPNVGIPLLSLVIGATMSLGPIGVHGTEEQKQKWLPAVARGEKMCAFCLSEKFAGSDAGADNWAVLASLLETCKLSDVDPLAWLTATLTKLANGHSNKDLDSLMPWHSPKIAGRNAPS